jgi:VWFA-related protein
MRALILVGALLSLAATQVPRTQETLEVSITNVDVIVTDGEGRHVRGLKREDFELYENGKRQPITHFTEYNAQTQDAATAAEREPRSLLLFIEPAKLPRFRVEPFLNSLKELVRKTITEKGDRVALIAFKGRAEVRVAPTSDLASLDRALDVLGEEFLGVAHNTTGAVADQMRELRQFEREGEEMAADAKIDRPNASSRSLATSAARLPAIQAELEMKRRIAAINAAVHAMSTIEGRKILVLATHRLGQLVGAEYFLATGAFGGEAADNRQAVGTIIANANAVGVTVYPVFPAGLDQTSADPNAPDLAQPILMNEMGSLTDIAKETGGLTAYGTTDIAKLMPRVADDVANYYSIAYKPTSNAARELVVKVKDRNLQVRTRRWFLRRTDKARMRDRLLAALYRAWSESPIPVTATLGEPKAAGKKKSVAMKVRVPIRALTLLPQEGKHSGAFTVYLMTGADFGEVSAVREETRAVDIPDAKLAAFQAGELTYEVDLVYDGDAERVAIAVLDEVSGDYGLLALPLR